MPKKNVSFRNDRGESLAGILDLPDTEPAAYALFAHCFTCSKNLKAAGHLSRAPGRRQHWRAAFRFYRSRAK